MNAGRKAHGAPGSLHPGRALELLGAARIEDAKSGLDTGVLGAPDEGVEVRDEHLVGEVAV
jgi:hypothetical protein